MNSTKSQELNQTQSEKKGGVCVMEDSLSNSSHLIILHSACLIVIYVGVSHFPRHHDTSKVLD